MVPFAVTRHICMTARSRKEQIPVFNFLGYMLFSSRSESVRYEPTELRNSKEHLNQEFQKDIFEALKYYVHFLRKHGIT